MALRKQMLRKFKKFVQSPDLSETEVDSHKAYYHLLFIFLGH